MICLIDIAPSFRGISDLTRLPSGLLYIGDALKKAGYEVSVFHLAPEETDSAVEKIAKINPLFIGFSLFSGYPCYVSACMAEKIKQRLPNTPIVYGGVHPSLAPGQCLNENFVDFTVIGEGEETIVELAEAIENKSGYDTIKGIGYKKDGAVIINPARKQIGNLDLHRMDWSLINPQRYVRPSSDGKKCIAFVTSRGCPFNCGFCYNESFHKRRWRAHSVDFIVEQITELKNATGISRISFDDDDFMVNAERGFEILARLQKNGILCDWIEMNLDWVTYDNMSRFSDLGLKTLFFGWESGSDRILKLINKKITRESIIEKCRILARFPQIKYDASAIIGFPTESWEEINQTIDLALKISDIMPSFNVVLGTYMPYPGTQLHNLALEEGFDAPKRIFDWREYDIVCTTMKPTWIKWANQVTGRKFFLIDKYAHFLDRSIYLSPGSSLLKTIVKRMLYHAAKFRLKNRLYAFPLEIYFQRWWTRRNILRDLSKFQTQ